MKKCALLVVFVIGGCLLAPVVEAQDDNVIYVPRERDSVNETLRERADSLKEVRDSITSAIRDLQKEYDETKRDSARSLRFEYTNVNKPEAPDVFESQFHFPPVRQYLTGTCWCFSAVSYMESEVYRLTEQEIKLSEMYIVYHEYLEKARYYVQQRGQRWPGQGSETNAAFRMAKKYGLVPDEDYPGYIESELHDHSRVSREVRAFMAHVKENDLWDEEAVLDHVRLILNRHFGTPPETIEFNGRNLTPKEFAEEILQLNPDDYCSVMSTLSQSFYIQGPLEVPDNWWHDSTYYNIPLDEWYDILVDAVDDGYTLTIGGDVSEPGWNGVEDACVIPDFDIPREYINQDSREYRIWYDITSDDHGVHLVGHTEIDGFDWFLIKDSGSSGHRGEFKGYYFIRDDYLRLKMLCFTVHKDAMKDILHKFGPSGESD